MLTRLICGIVPAVRQARRCHSFGLCNRAGKPRGMAAGPGYCPGSILLCLRNKTRGLGMPDSAVLTVTDPDEFQAVSPRLQLQGVVTSRGKYRAELVRIDLHQLWMHRGDESLSRVLNFTPSGERTTLLFATDQSQPAIHFRGIEVSHDEAAVTGFGSADHYRTSAACQWGALSLTFQDLAAAGRAIIGRELTAAPVTQRIRPPAPSLSRLLNLHEAAGHLAKTAPDMLAHREVARALEQALVHAMVSCIGGGETAESSSAHHRHALIVRRLEEVLEANPDRTLYVAELCAVTGASAGTLRACCQEHLGMSPMRYLWLRRMHLARRDLRMADPTGTTVTEIATNYGFWELGRFSVAYRSLFGESPSTSLRRPPEDPRPQKNTGSPWQLVECA
jgi:AraC-like DNA-binding protein